MATITMHLNKNPFERVRQGMQNVDARVNDVKRQCIAIGDTIEYVSLEDTTVRIVKRVMKLSKFKNFKELKEVYPETTILDEPVRYTDEAIEKYGVVAIELTD